MITNWSNTIYSYNIRKILGGFPNLFGVTMLCINLRNQGT